MSDPRRQNYFNLISVRHYSAGAASIAPRSAGSARSAVARAGGQLEQQLAVPAACLAPGGSEDARPVGQVRFGFIKKTKDLFSRQMREKFFLLFQHTIALVPIYKPLCNS